MKRLFLIMVVGWMGCGSNGGLRNPNSVGTCGTATTCGSGKSYQTCCTTTGCQLQTSDNQTIPCNATNCAQAATQLAAWCSGSSNSVALDGGSSLNGCSSPVSCGAGRSYKTCCAGSSCALETSDGMNLACNGTDCSSAINAVASWCGGGNPQLPDFGLGMKGDLAFAGPLSCSGLLSCENDCLQTATTQADFDTCAMKCETSTKMASLTKFQNAISCGQNYCTGGKASGVDASSSAKCGDNGTSLTELDGSPIVSGGVCDTCLNNALQGLFGGTCSPTNSPDCNPAACTPLFAACANDP